MNSLTNQTTSSFHNPRTEAFSKAQSILWTLRMGSAAALTYAIAHLAEGGFSEAAIFSEIVDIAKSTAEDRLPSIDGESDEKWEKRFDKETRVALKEMGFDDYAKVLKTTPGFALRLMASGREEMMAAETPA